MNTMLNPLFFLATFAFMEFMAWFTHKYVMHGFLWKLHKDHHVPTPGFFEMNDAFFLIFAAPSMVLIYLGINYEIWPAFSAGLGIMCYGAAYFLVHDVIIHQRFKWFTRSRNLYVVAVRRAHKAHHKRTGKEDGICFGMLVVPRRYFAEARNLLNA
ncbi:MAG: sterol desaturase family protein [Flavobacteriales bacterium]|nr:sterol desaturase family protein [Flavobacteriales bacterium]